MTIDEAILEEQKKREEEKLTIDQAINLLNHLECHGAYYKAKHMAIRSLEAWEKVKADISETILYYKDWSLVEIKAQHKEEALKEVLEFIDKHLKGVTE